jgi:two-component sensor histidine kinase
MGLENLPALQSPALRYGLAVAAVVAAALLRLLIDPFLPEGLQFITFFPAVIGATLVGGLGPGSLSAILSLIAGAWLFVLPAAPSPSAAAWAIGSFSVVLAIDVAIIHGLTLALARLKAERMRSQRLADHNAVLLSEAQHRISNNLQTIGALLRAQRQTILDPDAVRALDEAAARLSLIGKLQRDLATPGGTDLGAFIRQLCADVQEATGDADVRLDVSAVPLTLDPSQVTPLALVTLELVSNAIEHGGRRPLTIRVHLHQAGNDGVLTVEDDGIGIRPASVDQPDSLGLRLIRSLANQMEGSFEISGAPGARAVLCFPLETRAGGEPS